MQRMVLVLSLLFFLLRCGCAQTLAPSAAAALDVLAESISSATSVTSVPTHTDTDPDGADETTEPPRTINTPTHPAAAVRISKARSTTPRTSRSHSITVYSAPTAHHFPHTTHTPHPIHPEPPPDTPPRPHPDVPVPPDNPPPNPQSGSKHQPPVAIAFEVLAGLIGAFILFTLSRCVYSWRHTPNRDRIEGLLSRHYLEREMAERERQEMEQRILRSSSIIRPPPPPYISAPAYDEVADGYRAV